MKRYVFLKNRNSTDYFSQGFPNKIIVEEVDVLLTILESLKNENIYIFIHNDVYSPLLEERITFIKKDATINTYPVLKNITLDSNPSTLSAVNFSEIEHGMLNILKDNDIPTLKNKKLSLIYKFELDDGNCVELFQNFSFAKGKCFAKFPKKECNEEYLYKCKNEILEEKSCEVEEEAQDLIESEKELQDKIDTANYLQEKEELINESFINNDLMDSIDEECFYDEEFEEKEAIKEELVETPKTEIATETPKVETTIETPEADEVVENRVETENVVEISEVDDISKPKEVSEKLDEVKAETTEKVVIETPKLDDIIKEKEETTEHKEISETPSNNEVESKSTLEVEEISFEKKEKYHLDEIENDENFDEKVVVPANEEKFENADELQDKNVIEPVNENKNIDEILNKSVDEVINEKQTENKSVDEILNDSVTNSSIDDVLKEEAPVNKGMTADEALQRLSNENEEKKEEDKLKEFYGNTPSNYNYDETSSNPLMNILNENSQE